MRGVVSGIGYLLSAALLAAVAGCATTESAPDGGSLKEDQGLLVVRITSNTNMRLSYQEFSPETSFGARFTENMIGSKGALSVMPGEKVWVLPVDAGEYMWSKVEMGNQFANLHTSNRFRVFPNTITYIGDINIQVVDRRFRVRAVDREYEMREYIRNHYPAYSKSMKFEKVMSELRMR